MHVADPDRTHVAPKPRARKGILKRRRPSKDLPDTKDDVEKIDPADFGPDIPADAAGSASASNLPDGADLFLPSDDEDTTEFCRVVNDDTDILEMRDGSKH